MKLCHRNCYIGTLFIRIILTVLLLFTLLAGPAAANLLTWTLQDVTLEQGEIATGSFTLDTDLYNAIPSNTYGDAFTFVDIQVSGPLASFHFTDPLSAIVFHWSGPGYSAVQFGVQPGFSQPGIALWGILGTDISIAGIIPLTTDPFYVWGYVDAIGVTYRGTGGELVSPVPEPSTLLLLASGLIGLAGYGRKKFFKK